jgi:hypothetical protein
MKTQTARIRLLAAYGLGVKMALIDLIIEQLPELVDAKVIGKTILLQNDSDGLGDYIKAWDYDQPIPDGLTLGKPTA